MTPKMIKHISAAPPRAPPMIAPRLIGLGVVGVVGSGDPVEILVAPETEGDGDDDDADKKPCFDDDRD